MHDIYINGSMLHISRLLVCKQKAYIQFIRSSCSKLKAFSGVSYMFPTTGFPCYLVNFVVSSRIVRHVVMVCVELCLHLGL